MGEIVNQAKVKLVTIPKNAIPKDIVDASRNYRLFLPLEYFEDPGYLAAFNTIKKHWCIANEWVVKSLWYSKHKINASKKLKDALKPRGDLLIKTFQLCERCHAWQSQLDFEIPYKNAGEWFTTVELEFFGLELETLIEKANPINGNIKRGLIEVDRKRLRKLKEWENPYENTNAQSINLLVKSALIYAQNSDQFVETHWKPFIKAYADNLNDLTKNPVWGVGYIKDGKYFIQGGRGKGGEIRLCYGNIT